MESDALAETQAESDFNWTEARWSPLYPGDAVLAELGRVTMAAARVDRELALVLLALKISKDFPTLLKKSSSDMLGTLRRRVQQLFEGPLLDWTLKNLEQVQKVIEARHAAAHSIWTPADRSDFVSVDLLAEIRSQEELDQLLRERGSNAQWQTHHPKTNGPGPQSIDELREARLGLEDAEKWLLQVRFTLASALFGGTPPGAREVLDPRSFD